MITRVYYSVINCGDGSAYPQFFEDGICADFHQNLQSETGEGWGEDCTGYLEIESEGPVKIKNATSYEEYVLELKDELDDYKSKSPIRVMIEDFIANYEASLRNDKIDNIIK